MKDWSDGEIMRVLRSGIDPDGRWLLAMSNVNVRHMSDDDIESVIAYLRSQPAVVNETLEPPDQPTFLGAIMMGAGMLPEGEAPVTGSITAPPKGAPPWTQAHNRWLTTAERSSAGLCSIGFSGL